MANYNCDACNELREDAPNLIVNGLTNKECASLKNNTGLNPSSGNDDCTDLDNMNDCLIGNMEQEIDAYDVCDWKDFMRKFIDNLWTVLKGIICAICGIWTNIKRLNCLVNLLMNGMSFSIGEVTDASKSHVVAGKGVSFANVSESGSSADISAVYVAGGLLSVGGSVKLYTANFTDRFACYNYDNNGVDPTKSTARQGNSAWVGENTKPGGYTSELIYEIRIKKSEFPQIERLFRGLGLNEDGGGYHINFTRTPAGQYAYGQHGRCDVNTGEPLDAGASRGHLVPNGWEYIQCRCTWVELMWDAPDGIQYSPRGYMGIRMNLDNAC